MKVTLKVNNKVMNGIKQLRNSKVTVGWFENTKYNDGLPISQVAYWNEYGTTKDGKSFIPPRPFLRQAVSENTKKWRDLVVNDLKKVSEGDLSLEQALNRLGVVASGDVKETIADFSNPPNAPSTIKKKGFNDPLVDTGLMMNSVSHKEEIK